MKKIKYCKNRNNSQGIRKFS